MSEHHRKQYEKMVVDLSPGVAAPSEIGHVIAFLASDESAYLASATLNPTGWLIMP